MLTRCLAILLSMALFGCAVDPVPNRQCNFVKTPFEVDLPRFIGVKTLSEIVEDAYQNGSTPPNLLFMSGGSEHGAFGAGVLLGWGDKKGQLPDFQLVTGVSTGAILASPAFVGEHRYAASQYSDIWERDLLKPYASKRGEDIAWWSAPAVLYHGAVANLNPMRSQLKRFLVGEKGFERIAERADSAKLLVGAVDVDSGKMVAFDMTDMAKRIVTATRDGDNEGAEFLRNCYYDAIQASASAPLAATPVFIDNRMYADGGMRFSLFGENVIRILRAMQNEIDAENKEREEQKLPLLPDLVPPNMYLILNGTGETEVWCPRNKKDRRACDALADSEAQASGPPPKWDLIELGMRSVDILSNQVSRFSINSLKAENQLLFGAGAKNFRFLKIEAAAMNHPYEDPKTHVRKSCEEWRKEDVKRDQPLQFHHDYMACIVHYGKVTVGNNPDW